MPAAVSVPARRLDDLLTPDALAAQLHTTTRNLHESRATGRGTRFVRVGCLRLYRLEKVERWSREQEAKLHLAAPASGPRFAGDAVPPRSLWLLRGAFWCGFRWLQMAQCSAR
jgi:hypothetical protein